MSEGRATGKLATVAAGAALALAMWFIAPWEDGPAGPVLTGYADIVGVATACTGHTGPGVAVGKAYTPEQCRAWFASDVGVAMAGVDACITRPMRAHEWAAFGSLAFNVGVAAFCRSSIARLFNAGDIAGACRAIGLYVYAGGRKVKGLERRRQAEIALCTGASLEQSP